MSDTQRVTPEELEQLQDLARRHEEAVAEFGAVQYQKFVLEREEAALKQVLTQIDAERLAISETLRERFGSTGAVNLKTGDFVPE